jgi:hypothetical protein
MEREAQKPHPLLRKGWATPVCSRRSPTDAEFYSAATTVNVIIQACALKKEPSEGWATRGWTGGSVKPYENMTPDDRSHLAPPIDEQDVCYMNHDVCYANARCNNASCKKAENDAEGSCDMQLYYCLRGLANQNLHSYLAQPLFSLRELVK